ncbi:von Willebrand factor type A domain protein [Ancylostoma duodenale]|uniref:von Willebrand factor type A domain protein n=1 Tax=Ancylostoma duodenale TaxID=51022 RepID=A0A0C2GAN8_9BILA|nr:von Willebrand factor type A domain protein [Ancylostoma duodenale]
MLHPIKAEIIVVIIFASAYYLKLRLIGVKIYVVSVSADGFIPEMQRIAGDSSNVFGPDDLPLFKERLLKDVEESRVCESELMRTTVPIAKTQRRTKKIRRVLRRKLKRGPGLKRVDNTKNNSKNKSSKNHLSNIFWFRAATCRQLNNINRISTTSTAGTATTTERNLPQKYTAQGTTYIGAALELAQQLLEKRRPDVKTVVVLLSDGFSQDDATRPADAITAMKNVEFYAVSLSRLSNRNYLHQLVKDERRMAMDKDIGYIHNHLKSIFHCNN